MKILKPNNEKLKSQIILAEFLGHLLFAIGLITLLFVNINLIFGFMGLAMIIFGAVFWIWQKIDKTRLEVRSKSQALFGINFNIPSKREVKKK